LRIADDGYRVRRVIVTPRIGIVKSAAIAAAVPGGWQSVCIGAEGVAPAPHRCSELSPEDYFFLKTVVLSGAKDLFSFTAQEPRSFAPFRMTDPKLEDESKGRDKAPRYG